MVAYPDIPEVNALYGEIAGLDNAIKLIDAGGKLTSFMISPPPPDPEAPIGAPMGGMATMITVTDAPPALMDQAKAAMVSRYNAIIAELAALGVTAPPPTREGLKR